MPKVLLCGRGVYGIIREFLLHHLDKEEDFEVHDHCTPEGLPDLVADIAPDVVLMVVGVPGKDDVSNIIEVRQRFPQCLIIAVSLALDPEMALEPLHAAGADLIVAAEEALQLPNVVRELVAREGLGRCVMSEV